MNITKRTIWKLDFGDRGHWMERACEDIAKELGCGRTDLDDVAFATPEVAVEVGKLVLQKLADLTPWCDAEFADVSDRNKALSEVGGDHRFGTNFPGTLREARWASDPKITWESATGSIVMERATEVRWVMNRTVRREIQVEGETWTREFNETQESSWYQGSPDITVLYVGLNKTVEIG